MNFMTVVTRFPAMLIAAFFLKQWLCKLGSYIDFVPLIILYQLLRGINKIIPTMKGK